MKHIILLSLTLAAIGWVTSARACGGPVAAAGYASYPGYAATAPVYGYGAPVAPAVVYAPPVVYRPAVVYWVGRGRHGYYPAYHASVVHGFVGGGYHGGGHYGGFHGR